jgi:hypothetical protein
MLMPVTRYRLGALPQQPNILILPMQSNIKATQHINWLVHILKQDIDTR